MFGFTEEQVSGFGITVGLTLFIGYMLFIIYDLARQSKAGRMGASAWRRRSWAASRGTSLSIRHQVC